MEETEERKNKIKLVTRETKDAIINNSVMNIATRPALSAADMKKRFVMPIVDPDPDGGACAISEIDRVAGEAEAAVQEVYDEASKKIDKDEANDKLAKKLDKNTEYTSYPQAYVKAADGEQKMIDIAVDYAEPNSIPMRDAGGNIYVDCSNPDVLRPEHAINLRYLSDRMSTGAYPNKIVTRDDSGRFYVSAPTHIYHPVNLDYAEAHFAKLENGKVAASQLPSYIDDIVEYSTKTNFPATGEAGKIYLDLSTNLTWRWSGSTYVEVSPAPDNYVTTDTEQTIDGSKTFFNPITVSKNGHRVVVWEAGIIFYKPNSENPTAYLAEPATTSNVGYTVRMPSKGGTLSVDSDLLLTQEQVDSLF